MYKQGIKFKFWIASDLELIEVKNKTWFNKWILDIKDNLKRNNLIKWWW